MFHRRSLLSIGKWSFPAAIATITFSLLFSPAGRTDEQVAQEIRLPKSHAAQPMDGKPGRVLLLTINSKGELLVAGREQPLSTTEDIKKHLQQQFDDMQKAAKEKNEEFTTTIVLCADEGVKYGQVFEIFRLCKDIGFHKLALRATKTNDVEKPKDE